MIGCAAPATKLVETTPAERVAWLRAEVARAEVVNQGLRGSYLPRATPGGAIVCSLAIQIDAWYGFSDEKWELTRANASTDTLSGDTMLPARRSTSLREELARIGIRDCVLDVDR